jgi:transcriptional regulator with XRE-family HTH domain
VATHERRYDRGTERGRELITGLGRELRNARLDRGLSLRVAAGEARLSAPTLSRIERGRAVSVSFVTVARLMATVGLELSARAYPGGHPLRDAGHVELLAALRGELHRTVRWATEVPLPTPGDLRAWDAMVTGHGWMYGVEAETGPRDV